MAELTFEQRWKVVTGRLPAEALGAWEGVVGCCERGYHDDLDEYRFDLGARDVIQAALDSDLLHDWPEMHRVREQVAVVDARFGALLQRDRPLDVPPSAPWWDRYPLRFAGPRLAADYRQRYGVDVEVRG